jgi:type III secretion system chaperone SycN
MSLIADTVSEFGRSLGLDDLTLAESGGVVLEIDRIGALGFDTAGAGSDAVVVSLSRPLRPGWAGRWSEVLARTHYRERLGVPLQAGVWGDQIVFAAVLPTADFSLSRISEVMRALDGAHRAVEDLR